MAMSTLETSQTGVGGARKANVTPFFTVLGVDKNPWTSLDGVEMEGGIVMLIAHREDTFVWSKAPFPKIMV